MGRPGKSLRPVLLSRWGTSPPVSWLTKLPPDLLFVPRSLTWQLVAHACAFSAIPICTAYDSLGPSGLAHALKEPNCRSMFINSHLVPVLLQVIDQVTDLELVIFDGEVGEEDRRKLESVQRGEGKGLRVISIEEVEVIGKRKREETGEVWMGEKADPNQTYCIMYTSGSSESRVRLWIQARRCLSEKMADLARRLFVV